MLPTTPNKISKNSGNPASNISGKNILAPRIITENSRICLPANFAPALYQSDFGETFLYTIPIIKASKRLSINKFCTCRLITKIMLPTMKHNKSPGANIFIFS